jgi:L-lactate dehydrogenase complex protein LldG
VEEEPDVSVRDEMLGRIRGALADRPRPGPVPRDYLRTLDGVEVVALFAERAADYKATVTRVAAAQLPGAIAAALGPRRIVVPPGLPDEWLADAGIEPLRDDPPLSVHELDRSDGVISGCTVAIALTGTVVLSAGPAQGRRALTLLPDYHLCVVRADQIVGTVAQALARLDPTSPQTWISGPSATSDIELNRVEGVHGPRTLQIVIVEGSGDGRPG